MSFLHDYELTLRAIDIFLSSPNAGSNEAIAISQALASSALMSYFRSRGAGAVRLALDQLPEDLSLLHEKFYSIRNEYLAHSVNDLEMACIEVNIDDQEEEEVGLSTLNFRPATFSYELAAGLRRLVEAMSIILEEEHSREWDRVQAFVEAMSFEDRERCLILPEAYSGSTRRMKQRRKLAIK